MTPDQETLLFSAAIDGIIKIVEAVKAARSGKIDPAKVIDQISSLHGALALDNDVADREAKEKFHP